MQQNGNGSSPTPDPLDRLPPAQAPDDLEPVEPEFQIDPRDVASAGRSCSAILILMVAIVVVLIGGIILRWIFLS